MLNEKLFYEVTPWVGGLLLFWDTVYNWHQATILLLRTRTRTRSQQRYCRFIESWWTVDVYNCRLMKIWIRGAARSANHKRTCRWIALLPWGAQSIFHSRCVRRSETVAANLDWVTVRLACHCVSFDVHDCAVLHSDGIHAHWSNWCAIVTVASQSESPQLWSSEHLIWRSRNSKVKSLSS